MDDKLTRGSLSDVIISLTLILEAYTSVLQAAEDAHAQHQMQRRMAAYLDGLLCTPPELGMHLESGGFQTLLSFVLDQETPLDDR